MAAKVVKRKGQSKKNIFFTPVPSALLAKKIFIILIFLLAQYLFYYSDFFKLKEIKIFGNSRVSDRKIIQTASIPFEHNVITLPLAKFRSRLISIHWIKGVKIKWALPGQISIFVEERTPILLARKNGVPNKWYAIDEEGMPLYKARKQEIPSFPRLVVDEDIKVGSKISPEKVRTAKKIDSWISANLKKNIQYYLVDNAGKVVIRAERKGHPYKIKVGPVENMSHKMDVLGAFLELIEQNNTRVKYIDIRSNYPVMMPATPVVKKKKARKKRG